MIIVVGAVGAGVAAPPAPGSWTALGSPTSLATESGSSTLLMTKTDTNNDWFLHGYRMALLPTSNYELTVRLEPTLFDGNRNQAGIFLRESSSGKMVFFCFEVFAAGTGNAGNRICAYKLPSEILPNGSSPASYFRTTSPASTAGNQVTFTDTWLRITDTGSTRTLSQSGNGGDWTTRSTVSRTDYITPDQVGFGVMTNNDRGNPEIRIPHWALV